MTTISRRQLLTAGLLGAKAEPSSDREIAGWVRVGRVAAFLPGAATDVVLAGGRIVKVVSCAEGLQAALGPSEAFLPLRLAAGGWVEVELGGAEWPANVVLNILTGEQYPVELNKVEQN